MRRSIMWDRAPWILALASGIAFVVSIPLGFVSGANNPGDLLFLVPATPAIALYLWIGATIASRARN